MTTFQKQLNQFPLEIQKAFSLGFVFVWEKNHCWHFPAREWTETQIKKYFFERYNQDGHFIYYPELGLKQFVLDELTEVLIVVPYHPKEEND